MNKNGTPENLINFKDRTPEERKAIAAAGGRASGESRKARRTMADEFEIALSRPGTQAAIIQAMIQAAIDGNTTAAQFIRDTIGEKPTEKTETTLKQAQAEEERTREKVKSLYDKIG